MGLYMEISRVPLSTVTSKLKVHFLQAFLKFLFDAQPYYPYSSCSRYSILLWPYLYDIDFFSNFFPIFYYLMEKETI